MVTGPPRYAAIGNFDGVHRGHQALLAATSAAAGRIGAAPGAVVFEPHPRRYFRPNDPPFLLTTPARRADLLAAHGAAYVSVLPFTAQLVATSPEDFVVRVLKEDLGLAGAAVGADFRFGKARAGDADALRRLGAAAGLDVTIVPPLMDGGEKFGSSAVRDALVAGDVRRAAAMLGRPWSADGVVEAGRKLGRTIGFATANFSLGDLLEPRRGVYAVRAAIDGAAYDAIANFGRRPTVGEGAPLLETHIFDFAGDLYGRRLVVDFIDFIRDERKFDSLDALKAQIADDCDVARAPSRR